MGNKADDEIMVLPKGIRSYKYSDEEITRAIALYSLYHSAPKVSDITGIPQTMIYKWVDKANEDGLKADVVRRRGLEAQKDLVNSVSFVMESALQQVFEKLDEASAVQSATIFGILFDKRQILLNGSQASQTNVLIDTGGMTDEDKADLLRRVLNRQTSVEVDAEVVEDTDNR